MLDGPTFRVELIGENISSLGVVHGNQVVAGFWEMRSARGMSAALSISGVTGPKSSAWMCAKTEKSLLAITLNDAIVIEDEIRTGLPWIFAQE